MIDVFKKFGVSFVFYFLKIWGRFFVFKKFGVSELSLF